MLCFVQVIGRAPRPSVLVARARRKSSDSKRGNQALGRAASAPRKAGSSRLSRSPHDRGRRKNIDCRGASSRGGGMGSLHLGRVRCAPVCRSRLGQTGARRPPPSAVPGFKPAWRPAQAQAVNIGRPLLTLIVRSVGRVGFAAAASPSPIPAVPPTRTGQQEESCGGALHVTRAWRPPPP
jgi:hypothetical protein